MDVEEAAALVKLADTWARKAKELEISNRGPENEVSANTSGSYLMPFMDMAVKFHSWIPFFGQNERQERLHSSRVTRTRGYI